MDGTRLTTYTAQDAGASIELTPGAEFEVRLDENPTTGYRWRAGDWDQSIVDVTHEEFRPAERSGTGAGGEHVWQLQARAPGKTVVRLTYGRGWESGAAAREFSLTVTVA